MTQPGGSLLSESASRISTSTFVATADPEFVTTTVEDKTDPPDPDNGATTAIPTPDTEHTENDVENEYDPGDALDELEMVPVNTTLAEAYDNGTATLNTRTLGLAFAATEPRKHDTLAPDVEHTFCGPVTVTPDGIARVSVENDESDGPLLVTSTENKPVAPRQTLAGTFLRSARSFDDTQTDAVTCEEAEFED